MNQDMDLNNRVLGETAGILRLPDRAAIRTASRLMAAGTTRELRIFSRDLDAPLYDQEDFLESVRKLALHSSRSLVKVLVFNTDPAIHKGHRLIELARQLTSRIQIRRVPPEFCHKVKAYLIADDRGYVLRPLAEVFEGTTDFCAPMQVRRLHRDFEHIWERSPQPLELIAFGRGL